MSNKKNFDSLVYIHTMPKWLEAYLDDPHSDYYTWSKDYERLIVGKQLWRVWMIDEFGAYWIELNYMDEKGLPVFHTIKIEHGTYAFVETEKYKVIYLMLRTKLVFITIV